MYLFSLLIYIAPNLPNNYEEHYIENKTVAYYK